MENAILKMIKYIRIYCVSLKRWYTFKTEKEFERFLKRNYLDIASPYFKENYRVIIKHENKQYEQIKLSI